MSGLKTINKIQEKLVFVRNKLQILEKKAI